MSNCSAASQNDFLIKTFSSSTVIHLSFRSLMAMRGSILSPVILTEPQALPIHTADMHLGGDDTVGRIDFGFVSAGPPRRSALRQLLTALAHLASLCWGAVIYARQAVSASGLCRFKTHFL